MKISRALIGLFVVSALSFFVYPVKDAAAHCDGMDGPVVKAAEEALKTSNVNLVLPWVKKDDEQSIREAFAQTLEVRKLNSAAKDLADRYFFETLVRVHRVGEGAPFTGLKPAGSDVGPAIRAADKAIETRSSKAVLKLLTAAVHHGIQEHFNSMLHAADYDKNNVAAGREYVEKYVGWVHYVNGIHQAAVQGGGHQAGHNGAQVHDED